MSLNVKHNKIKNTAILYELLSRQITADVINDSSKPKSVKIFKEFFNKNTELGKEYALYQVLLEKKYKNDSHAATLVEAVIKSRRKLSNRRLNNEKYNLIKTIKENYDILIILSSIQLIPKDHGWEKWYNFPHEREKILKLVSDNKKLTIILSGDRHIGGMYKYNGNLFEVTSSSFNQRILKFIEEDKYSIGEIVNENNFGLMNINSAERLIDIELRAGFFKENKIFKKLKLQF